MSDITILYRHFDVNSALLYVGISCNPFERTKSHTESLWFSDIANITLEHFPNRSVALKAEKAAIKTEFPKYNIHHNIARESLVPLYEEEKPKTFDTDDWTTVSEFAALVGRKSPWIMHYLHNGSLRRMRFGNQWFIHRSCLNTWPPPKKKLGPISKKHKTKE